MAAAVKEAAEKVDLETGSLLPAPAEGEGTATPVAAAAPAATAAPAAEATPAADATPEAQGAPSTEVVAGTPGGESETPTEGTDDTPTEYFGVDLSFIEDATERAKWIHEFQERDTFISQLLRDKAQGDGQGGDKPPAQKPAVESGRQPGTESQELAPQADKPDLSDEALAQALGLDLEDPYDAKLAAIAVPLARQNLELQSKVEDLSSSDAVRETQAYWETSLDKLESQFGKLPVDHLKFYEFAADNGIAEPAAAYWQVVGPAKAEVMQAAQKKRVEVAEALAAFKRQASGVRPSATVPGEDAGLQSKNTKDAVKEAMLKVQEKLGIDIESARKASLA